eukprot:7037523-Prymnesium_polylepis.2
MILGPRWWCGGRDDPGVWKSDCPFAHARVAMRSVRTHCSHFVVPAPDVSRSWPPPPSPPAPWPPPPPPHPPFPPASVLAAASASKHYAQAHNCAIRVKDAFSRLVRQACLRLASTFSRHEVVQT